MFQALGHQEVYSALLDLDVETSRIFRQSGGHFSSNRLFSALLLVTFSTFVLFYLQARGVARKMRISQSLLLPDPALDVFLRHSHHHGSPTSSLGFAGGSLGCEQCQVLLGLASGLIVPAAHPQAFVSNGLGIVAH